MSSKVKSLEDALQKRRAKQGAQAQQFSVEGESPERLPHAGETVDFCWADPNLVGGPKMSLGLLVSMAIPNAADGRVNGWVIMDPTMSMPDPRTGEPIQVPALIPVLNAAYSREAKPMTWRYHGDQPKVEA